MQQPSLDRGRQGFTLTDLIVIIVILGMLTVLLLPIMTSRRETPRRTGCLGNLSQIGKSLKLYAMDQPDEAFPTNLHHLAAYADQPRMYICPSAVHVYEVALTVYNFTITNCGYKYASGYSEAAPSNRKLAGDKNGIATDTGATSADWGGNHGGHGGNVLFLDGSVRWVTAAEFAAAPAMDADWDGRPITIQGR